MGWVLICLDVCFVLGSLSSLLAVLYLLNTHVREGNGEDRSNSLTKVLPAVPAPSKADDSDAASEGSGEGPHHSVSHRRRSRSHTHQALL